MQGATGYDLIQPPDYMVALLIKQGLLAQLDYAQLADVIAYLRRFPQVYITWDVDSLDPAYAPGPGTPNAGGLAIRELLEFFHLVVPALPVRALDVVEIAPPLDHADMTTWAAIKIMMETLSMVQAKGAAAA